MLIACVSLSAGATEREGKMKRKSEGEEEREKKEGRRGGKGTQWVRESQWRGYALSSAGKESSTCFEGGESPSISARPRLTYDSPWSWRTTKLMIYWTAPSHHFRRLISRLKKQDNFPSNQHGQL